MKAGKIRRNYSNNSSYQHVFLWFLKLIIEWFGVNINLIQLLNSCLSTTLIIVCMLKLSWFSEHCCNVFIAFDLMYIIFSNTSISSGYLREKKQLHFTNSIWAQKCGEFLGGSWYPQSSFWVTQIGRETRQGQTLLKYPWDSNCYLIPKHEALATSECKLRRV